MVALLVSKYAVQRGKSGWQSQQGAQVAGDGGAEQRRDGVADLTGYLDLVALELEPVGERLQSSGFPVGDRPVGHWVQVAALLRFEEFGADGRCRAIPPEP